MYRLLNHAQVKLGDQTSWLAADMTSSTCDWVLISENIERFQGFYKHFSSQILPESDVVPERHFFLSNYDLHPFI